MFGVIIALFAVLVIREVRYNSARSLFGGSIQPAEFAKLFSILYLSVWLTNNKDMLKDFKNYLLPLSFGIGFIVALILAQPDLSAGLTVLMLGIMVLYYFSGHAIGITRAVQFNIDKFYPKFLAGAGMKSFFTDIAVKIPPQNEMIGIMGSYQLGLMTYGQLITVIVTASYAVLFTLLIAFPLSVYFRVTSLFFGRIAGK